MFTSSSPASLSLHRSGDHLFLGTLGLGGISGALLAGAEVALLSAGFAEANVGTALDGGGDLALLDLLDGNVGGGNGQDGGDAGGLVDLGDIGLGVTLLGGVGLAGEQDQALLVGLEAGDVDGQGLLGKVLAAEVNGDTDGGSQRAGDARLL